MGGVVISPRGGGKRRGLSLRGVAKRRREIGWKGRGRGGAEPERAGVRKGRGSKSGVAGRVCACLAAAWGQIEPERVVWHLRCPQGRGQEAPEALPAQGPAGTPFPGVHRRSPHPGAACTTHPVLPTKPLRTWVCAGATLPAGKGTGTDLTGEARGVLVQLILIKLSLPCKCVRISKPRLRL